MNLSQADAHTKVTQEKGLCSVTTFKALSCASMKMHLIRETASSNSVNKLNKDDLIKRHQSMWNDIGSAPPSGMDSIESVFPSPDVATLTNPMIL